MGGGELKFIQEAFDQNWFAALGPNVDNLEKDLAQYLGIGHAAALSSETADIHLVLILQGIRRGDKVAYTLF